MADLQQIVSAILRDLAKARFSADIFSRSVSRYYEQDFLLRRFPVPRTEIEEVEVELKFSIRQVLPEPLHTENREAALAVVLERHVERIVAGFVDAIADRIPAELNEAMSYPIRSAPLRIGLRQDVLRYFVEDYLRLIDEQGRFDAKQALAGVEDTLHRSLSKQLDPDKLDPDARAMAKESLGRLVRDSLPGVEPAVTALIEPVHTAWTEGHDAKIEAVIDPETLGTLPEAAISSLRIKASVRNYMWTEVTSPDGKQKPWRALTSE